MKIKQISSILIVLSLLLFISIGRADWITATNSGSWGDSNIWDSGTVPGTNDFAEVDSPYVVTIDTNAIVQYIEGSGTVTMAAGSLLNIMDPAGANGTYDLADLDTSSPSNTVLYSNNPFWAKHQNYCNLIFSNTATTTLIDFFNGNVNSYDPAAAMTISGDMTVIGKIKVQQGADFTISGNLIMGTNSQWDCSSFNLTVMSNTVMGGLMLDLDAASGSDNFMGNMLIASSALGWNISDVTNWMIGGSLTNNALIVGTSYGEINFNGAGTIAGKAFTIPTMVINGNYTIATTITLATNTPTLNGTLTFDLANTNQIIFKTGSTTNNTLYYSGNFNVINSGPAPTTGNVYKFFDAASYDGAFNSETFPSLATGLIWLDNLTTSGSISVTGSAGGTLPVITSPQYNPSTGQFTLTWTSEPDVTYSILFSTNLTSGNFTDVLVGGIPSGGSSTTYTVTVPNGETGFIKISQP